MITGQWKTATIALNGILSGEVDLGRPYDTLLMAIPTIDSAQVNIKVAEKIGGTFQDVHITEGDGTSAVVKTDIGTGGITWVVPLGGFQFIKVQTSAAQTGGARVFRVCGCRS